VGSHRCRQALLAINAGKNVLGYEKGADGLVDRQEKYENAETVWDIRDACTIRKEPPNRLEKADREAVGRVGQGDGIGWIRGQPS